MRRVVITGMGAVTPLGHGVSALMEGLEAGGNAVKRMEGWDRYRGLRSLVGAPAELRNETEIPRRDRRSMGRMSIFAAQSANQAVEDAGLSPSVLAGGRTACIIGSTMGSSCSISETFEEMLPDHDLSKLTSMQFFKCVSHSAAMNVAQYLNISGSVLATSAACASGLQAIGAGYDLIRLGRQDVALCGGAEELHPTVTGSFDILFATSVNYTDTPERTPRPFDRDRDGLVCGEGSGIVVLEEYEQARRRNARMRAEIIGYHTCGSGSHVSQSSHSSMIACMREALEQAAVAPDQVDYVNAHATATEHGDAEEAVAIREVFGGSVPVSSLKGSLGHTLGASGGIEVIGSLVMMDKGVVFPTRNLENVAPDCDGIRHVQRPLETRVRIFLKNSFAFGGINAVLVCRAI